MNWFQRPPWQPNAKVGLERVELPPDPPVPPSSAALAAAPGPGWAPRVTGGTGTEVWTWSAADADDALAVWQQWRGAHQATGWWPILADPDFWESVDQRVPAPADVAATGAEWLSRRLYGGNFPLADRLPRGGTVVWSAPIRREPSNYLGATEVVLVPAAAGWQVPEVLGWAGARKFEIYGPQHSLVLRRWAGLWGAEPQGMGGDELVLRVSRPPKRGEEAWQAAVELVAYCPETVRADADTTVDEVAASMVDGLWDILFDLDDPDELSEADDS